VDTLANLRDYVRDELGSELGAASFISDTDVDRYLNDGLKRLGYFLEKAAVLTWDTADLSVALPSDFISEDRLEAVPPYTLPYERRIWGNVMYFQANGAVTAGSANLYYFGYHPALSVSQDSVLPETGDTAIVAFACYRAYKRIASSRANYQRYSTLVAGNGVDVAELASISDQYYAEFLEARDGLPSRQATTFYGD
jgi:hypothetical protein